MQAGKDRAAAKGRRTSPKMGYRRRTEKLGKRGEPRETAWDRDARAPTEDLAPTCGQAKQIRLALEQNAMQVFMVA